MKKFFAFAFVAGMVAFASCTSKPADESGSADSTVEAAPMTADTMSTDTTMMADTTAADTTKK
ncbi:hypothetical protein [Dyadobacter luticola]|uniref:Entericidin n=1 Tax=Dyadobacter luticola TaxID=1979387 RepID=A0A5R9KWC5_9BACT|nr:hypothetical protein [Dyadobacter luticola]TLV00450.1 hypothetical protein FEN17_13250 [Dyadobacter luticola]